MRVRGSGFQTKGQRRWSREFSDGLERHIQEKQQLIDKVIEIQKREGLSDGQMAEKIGLTRQLWQMTRTGERAISITLLKGIARHLPELEANIMSFLKSDGEAGNMKLVYGISRWTNASRPSARHIDNGQGMPLCGGRGRKAFTWEKEEGQPTCQRCIDIYRKGESDNVSR